MPLVHVRYKPTAVRYLKNGGADRFADAICASVASNFSCEGDGELTPEDIEVFFDPASPFDRSVYDLFVAVEIRHNKLRDQGYAAPQFGVAPGIPNFDERSDRLRTDLRQAVPSNLIFGGWIKLVNARWVETEGALLGLGSRLENPLDEPDHITIVPTYPGEVFAKEVGDQVTHTPKFVGD